MQQSNKTQESWSTQLNAKHPDNTQLITSEKIEGSPFHITGGEEHGYFISMGLYRMSPKFKYQDEAFEYLRQEQWNLIFQLIVTLMNVNTKMEEEEKDKQPDLKTEYK